MSPYCCIVPILDVDEWMLLTRQEVLSGSCFPTMRTDALGKSPRKFLFMKLLYRTIFSSDLNVQVEGMIVDHDLSLRPIVDLSDNKNVNNNSATGDGYDDDDDAPASAADVDDSAATATAASIVKAVADADTYKGRSKDSRGSERQQTALKQIKAFGDFSFSTSLGSTTRNSVALSKSSAAIVKPPAAKAKLVAAAKTKQQSPKRKPPPSLPPQQLPKKGTTTKSNQVVVAAAGTGRGGKAQRSCGGSIPIVSTAEKMLQDEMKETAKEVRREKEEWKREKEDAKREREQAKREREQLKREREEFEKAQKQAPPQRKLGIVFIVLVLILLYDS